jgi:hypothetical protein
MRFIFLLILADNHVVLANLPSNLSHPPVCLLAQEVVGANATLADVYPCQPLKPNSTIHPRRSCLFAEHDSVKHDEVNLPERHLDTIFENKNLEGLDRMMQGGFRQSFLFWRGRSATSGWGSRRQER